MQYQAFMDLVLARCRTLTFADPDTTLPDAGEVEMAAYQSLLELADGWDFDFFTVINTNMGTTTAGVTQYALPSNFGRLRVPREDYEAGIYLADTAGQPIPLWYRDHANWFRLATTTNARPSYFALSGNHTLFLDPPPDTNGGSNYTIQGVYIRRVEVLDGNDPILVSHPTALIACTLARLALDKGATQAQTLAAERNIALSKLANNQARVRQQFRPRYTGKQPHG